MAAVSDEEAVEAAWARKGIPWEEGAGDKDWRRFPEAVVEISGRMRGTRSLDECAGK